MAPHFYKRLEFIAWGLLALLLLWSHIKLTREEPSQWWWWIWTSPSRPIVALTIVALVGTVNYVTGKSPVLLLYQAQKGRRVSIVDFRELDELIEELPPSVDMVDNTNGNTEMEVRRIFSKSHSIDISLGIERLRETGFTASALEHIKASMAQRISTSLSMRVGTEIRESVEQTFTIPAKKTLRIRVVWKLTKKRYLFTVKKGDGVEQQVEIDVPSALGYHVQTETSAE